MITIHPLTASARRSLSFAREALTQYIRLQIAQAGTDYALATLTGIPRSTIAAALRRQNVAGLLRVAEKIESATSKIRKKNLTP